MRLEFITAFVRFNSALSINVKNVTVKVQLAMITVNLLTLMSSVLHK